MGRHRVLPLPDEIAKELIAGVDQLENEMAGANPRQFLSHFIDLVYRITGTVYGQTTYRKMLQLYAPKHRPSSDTIQAQILQARARYEQRTESLERRRDFPQLHSARIERSEAITEPRPTLIVQDTGHAELNRFLELDNTRLKASLATAEARLIDLNERLARAVDELRQTERNLAAAEARVTEQTSIIERLTATIENLRVQADFQNRLALEKIDAVRGETRAVQNEKQALISQIAKRESDLRNEQVLNDQLRRLVSDLQRQLHASR